MSRKESPKTAAETLDVLLAFLRHCTIFWKRSLFAFVLVALVSIPGVFLKARIYKSETVVLWQETIKATDIVGGESGENARRVGARLREMLLSRQSLEPIVKDVPRYAQIADRRGMVDAVDELRGHIGFKAREGDTFEIGYEAPAPAEAQEVTRRLGDRIVEEAASRRAEQAIATKQYLEAQSEQNKTKLREADSALSTFLALHPEFIPETAMNKNRAGFGVGVANASAPPSTKDAVLFQLEVEARAIENKLKASATGAPPAAPSVPVESPEVTAARRDLEQKKSMYTDSHPDVIAAKRRLETLLASAPAPPATAATAGKLSNSEREALEAKLASLRRSIATRRAAAASGATATGTTATGTTAFPAPSGSSGAVANEVEFRRLQHDVEMLKDAQRMLDDKLFKAGLTAGASASDRNIQVKVLDPAYLPVHPSSKPRSTLLLTYLGAGFGLALAIALLSARLDDRIFHASDLEVLDILPIVGVIPLARPDEAEAHTPRRT
jgi:uncharacterized protein involved in exopolysaccharide biosynthesis